jgi:hypothetical protein
MQCDGVSGAVASREKTFAANRAPHGHGAQASRHVAERHREKLAFDLAFAAGLVLQRPMQQCAIERSNSDRRVAEIGTLREYRGDRETIFVNGDAGRRGQARRRLRAVKPGRR